MGCQQSDKYVIRICRSLDLLDIRQHFKLHYWPPLGFSFGILAVIIAYIISVAKGHVYIFFPYISNVGALPPESCIFGIMLAIGSLITELIFYIKYRQIDFDIDSGHISISKEWNTLSIWLGTIIAIGMCMIGHFQETSMYAVHIGGALFSLGLGSSYFLIQTKISYADKRNFDLTDPNYEFYQRMLKIRTFLSLSLYPLFVTTAVFGAMAINEFTGKSTVWWTEEDGGFPQRLVSTFSEWLVAFFMFLYVLTYTNDFKRIKFENITFINTLKSATDSHIKSH